MATTDKNTIYSWFQTDDFPTEDQFRATWDSFWHKSESIPMSSISGLNQLFQQTATVAQLNDKANVDGSNIDVSAYQEKLNITNLIATAKEEVKTELLNGAPEAFDTLKEISDWISDDETAEGAILQAIQTEAAARTEADNLKLNKPTTTSTTASYPYVVGEDGNGNSARLPAGDLGKNFFNSDLSNTTARNHTMNAGVTVNTLGNPHTLSGLPNKNADITNFRKVRVQNASGLDSVVDSKNLLTDGVTFMSDAEKDAWRLAQRKTGETYSVGVPIIRNLSRLVINSNISYVQYLSLIGENLYVNPSTSILKFIRVKDVTGTIITPVEYLINTFTSYYDNTSLISFGLNFNSYPEGYYVLTLTNNGLESARSPEVLLKLNYTNIPVNINWTYIPPTYSRTQTNDILTTNSVELIGLDTSTTHQDYLKVGCVYESDFIITQEMIATNFLLEIQNYVTISSNFAHETIPTKIQILDYNNIVVAGLDLAIHNAANVNSVNILPQNSNVIPTPSTMGNDGLSYLLGQKISISYKDGILTYFSILNQGLIFYNKSFIPNWDSTLHPMGFKLRISIGGNTWGNSTVLSKKTQITNLTTI